MKAKIGTFPQDRQVLHEILPLDTPLCVDIHMTHLCNFRCNYCLLSQPDEIFAKSGLPREVMTWEDFSLLVEQLKGFPSKIKMITMCGIGEATTHPRVVDMVKALYDANVTEKIQIITNGALLTPELGEKLVAAGLSELRISLQGLSAEKYLEVAGVEINWDIFYANICHFSKIKGNCELKVKVADIALEPGEDELFYALFGDICDAVAIEHIYDAWTQNNWDLDIEQKPSQKTRYGLDPRIINVCRYPLTRFDILPNGMFTQFCHIQFGHEKHIRECSVVEQWNSLQQHQFQLRMLKGGRSQFSACKVCNMCESTWHPEDILEGHEAEIIERMKQKYGIEDEE